MDNIFDGPFGDQQPITPGFGTLQTRGAAKLLVVVFVVDCSMTMAGDRIAAVNAALQEVKFKLNEIKTNNSLDLKVAVMSFTSNAKWDLQLTPIEEVDLKTIKTRPGLTEYGTAFHELNKVLRKERFMKHTGKIAPPAIMFLTDGEPTDDYQTDLDELLQNGWFANASRSAVLLGDAIYNESAKDAVRKFVNDGDNDIVAADDSTVIIQKIKIATMHTIAGEPMMDGPKSVQGEGKAAGGNWDAAGRGDPFGGNAGDNSFGGNAADGDDPFGDGTVFGGSPFGSNAARGGNPSGGSASSGSASSGDGSLGGNTVDGGSLFGGDMADGGNLAGGNAAGGDSLFGGDTASGRNLAGGNAVNGDSLFGSDTASGGNLAGGNAADGGSLFGGNAASGDNLFGSDTAGGDDPFLGNTTDGGTSFGGSAVGGGSPFGGSVVGGDNPFGGNAVGGDASFSGGAADGGSPSGGNAADGDGSFSGSAVDGDDPFSVSAAGGDSPSGGTVVDGDDLFWDFPGF